MRKKLFATFSICGACISFYIGAGFATMQEIMQYEVSYGSEFFIVILVSALIYIYTNVSFATNGHRLQLQRGGEIYGVYCGVINKSVGRFASLFFDYFSAFFCYLSFIVMIGGASSTFAQQWNMPAEFGAIIMSLLVSLTVLMGLSGIIKSLGMVGPVIVVMILVVSIFSVFMGVPELGDNLKAIDQGLYADSIKQVGGGSPLISGISYGGFVILWFAAFLAEIGAKNRLRDVNIGMTLSSLFIFGTSAICCIALIGNISFVANTDIPALALAGMIHPFVAGVYAIIICLGIYTSAVPLLWTSVRKIASEGTLLYKFSTFLLGLAGCVIACFVPYKGLLNIVYGINGYLGAVLVVFMLLYDIKTKMSKSSECQCSSA